MMLIVDAHEDIAWNIRTFGRDYTTSAAEIRLREVGTDIPALNDDTLLGWSDYQRGKVAVIFATLFSAPVERQMGLWDTQCYTDPEHAHQIYRAQLDEYHRLAGDNPEKFRLVQKKEELERLLSNWEQTADPREGIEGDGITVQAGYPVGMVVLMEGAEGVRAPGELEEWWQRGVRVIGPAWAGTRFCGGTHQPGPLTKEGFALLEAMAGFPFSLDLSHMDEQAVLQALDFYGGPIIASHSNAQALLKGAESNRHLSDRVIQGILERDGIIGAVLLNSFLKAGWRRGDPREQVSLQDVITQIDHICQIAGDARHAGIGSDFDGGFGLQSTPPEIDTVADLQKLAPLLVEKGYSQEDIAAILGGNWIHHLRQALPESV